jgi:DNA-binding protein HU-beta
MNKQELISKVAESTNHTKKEIGVIVESVFDVITATLSSGEKVQIVGFGNFEVRERLPRKGRNPQTGEEIDIPASRSPAFKAGKALKDGVNAQFEAERASQQ